MIASYQTLKCAVSIIFISTSISYFDFDINHSTAISLINLKQLNIRNYVHKYVYVSLLSSSCNFYLPLDGLPKKPPQRCFQCHVQTQEAAPK